MTRFFEFLKRQPMMTAVLALMIAMAGVGLPQESYLTRAVLRVLLTGTMLFLLSLISGEKTLSQGDNQTGYVIRQLMGFLILAAIAGVLTAVGTVVQGQVRPGILLRLVTLLPERRDDLSVPQQQGGLCLERRFQLADLRGRACHRKPADGRS